LFKKINSKSSELIIRNFFILYGVFIEKNKAREYNIFNWLGGA